MYYYRFNNKNIISDSMENYQRVSEDDIKISDDTIYYLFRKGTENFRRSFCLSHPSLIYNKKEDLSLLIKSSDFTSQIPQWLNDKMSLCKVKAVNALYPNFQDCFYDNLPKKWKINLVGLGDVGGILLTGLRLLGGDQISSIGIFDLDQNKLNRWEFETNQIISLDDKVNYPGVHILKEEELFNCDMFIFCVSTGIPPISSKITDVRMAQFDGNSKVIRYYAKMARNTNYKGIFSVVSDPVDLLCKVAFNESNKNDYNKFDYKGIPPENIRGYGLGVMHARALYYASQNPSLSYYKTEGRAYGPHGEGIVIADSIENYNDEYSNILTEKAKKANIQMRSYGFKPFVAPALSSGCLSIISTIKSEYNLSSIYIGGTFMGCKNRLTNSGTDIERCNINPFLLEKLQKSYDLIGSIYS